MCVSRHMGFVGVFFNLISTATCALCDWAVVGRDVKSKRGGYRGERPEPSTSGGIFVRGGLEFMAKEVSASKAGRLYSSNLVLSSSTKLVSGPDALGKSSWRSDLLMKKWSTHFVGGEGKVWTHVVGR